MLSFLQLTVIRTPPDFFGMTTGGLEYGEVECWIRPAARYLFKVASASLAKIGLILWGREVTGALSSRTEISECIREQEPKSVLDLEKTSAKSHRTSPSCSMARGLQPGPSRSKETARRCDGSRSQTRRSEACCSGVKRPIRAGEGEAGASTAARGGAVTAETGVTPGGQGKGRKAGRRPVRRPTERT